MVSRPLNIGFPHVWDERLGDYLRVVGAKHPLNPDHNSGDPLGMAVCQVSALGGYRTTASRALLSDPPANLSIMTESVVEKVLVDAVGQKAIGVQTSGAKSWTTQSYIVAGVFDAKCLLVFATKEVLLSAGAIDSPKLLLLSGIGPRNEIESHGIPLIRDVPSIGKNLQDHLWLEIVTVQKPNRPHRTSYINSPATLEEARAEWMKNKSGPLTDYFLPQVIAYLKSEVLIHSKEFQDLDRATQKALQADTRPHYELISVSR